MIRFCSSYCDALNSSFQSSFKIIFEIEKDKTGREGVNALDEQGESAKRKLAFLGWQLHRGKPLCLKRLQVAKKPHIGIPELCIQRHKPTVLTM